MESVSKLDKSPWHGFEHMDRLTGLADLIDHIGQRLAR